MIRVLITDDDHLVRQTYSALLLRAKDMQVVGEAKNGQEGIDFATTLAPDVILMDIKMPILDGLTATERICAQPTHSKVLVIAMTWTEELVRQALKNGALGYVAKTELFAELLPAIRAVQEGQRYFSASIRPLLSSDGHGNLLSPA